MKRRAPAAGKKTARRKAGAGNGAAAATPDRGHWISVADMDALQNRLREAQETLDAIRNGEVDAVVVNGDRGSQVYSLMSAEQPYRVYVEQMQEGAVTVSPDGVILYCNQRFADMVSLPLERVISSSFTDRVSKDAWKKISAVLKEDSPGVKHEDVLKCSAGQIAVSFAASRLPLEDQSVICLVVADLTMLREQESLRLAKEVADKANRAKDVFLAALSHELRTPLTPALMAVADMESDARLTDEVRDAATLIRRCIDLETRLIDDLLDITRIVRGRLELKSSTFDLHEALHGALGICQHDIKARQLNVELHLDAAQSRTHGDLVRIQQAFWNLIRNAVKFTAPGGNITIRTRNESPQEITFEVSDTGIGFPPESAARLFTAFEQGDDSVARQFGGLGLGLTISKSVADAHGGTIRGVSQGKGRGATFTIQLPLRGSADAEHPPATPPAPAAAAPQEHEARGMQLLLVEDHQETRQLMQRLLKRMGHHVTATNSAQAALAAAASRKFDLVVSDLGLPDMSGLEMMQQMRDLHGLRGIAVSGFGTEEDVAESRAAGFVRHLTKPISIEKLSEMLSALR
jgi:signal transduction histidine kinase